MSQSDVLSAARAAAEQAGGGWSEQVGVRAFREQGRVLWSVTTHAHLRGGNTRVSIDDATGEVVEVRVLPR